MTAAVTEDRGLDAAYARYAIGQQLEGWAEAYGIETMLEGPLDGFDGIAGVHGAGLAKRGVRVVSAVPTEDHAAVARSIHAAVGAATSPAVLVASPADLSSLPRADLVFSYDALGRVADWRGYLGSLAKLANSALVVVTSNPESWGAAMSRAFGKLRGAGASSSDAATSQALAPELWSIGRVRAHTYFDAPWWPSSSWSPSARLPPGRSGGAFVYGAERWPHAGGPVVLRGRHRQAPEARRPPPRVRGRRATPHAAATSEARDGGIMTSAWPLLLA